MLLTWKDIKDGVDVLLTEDADRLNVTGFKDRLVRRAAIDLQTYIPQLRKAHQSFIPSEEFMTEGEASVGNLPHAARIWDVFIIDDNADPTDADDTASPCDRIILDAISWDERYNMVCGSLCPQNGRGYFAQHPSDMTTVYIWPKIAATQRLVLHWQGRKFDFNDDEQTPFPEQVITLIYQFVKSFILLDQDGEPTRSKQFMDDYKLGRRILKAEYNQ